MNVRTNNITLMFQLYAPFNTSPDATYQEMEQANQQTPDTKQTDTYDMYCEELRMY